MFTDDTVAQGEVTLYFQPAGKDLYGQPLYQFQNFCKLRLNDPSDPGPEYFMPFSIMHPIANDQNVGNPVQFRFRMEMVSGAVPAPASTDKDQQAIHFIGPV